jgi:hypothetical protein
MAIWKTTAAGVMLFSRRLAWRDRMARSAWVALVAALLFGGTSLATGKTRGAAHRNPFPSSHHGERAAINRRIAA